MCSALTMFHMITECKLSSNLGSGNVALEQVIGFQDDKTISEFPPESQLSLHSHQFQHLHWRKMIEVSLQQVMEKNTCSFRGTSGWLTASVAFSNITTFSANNCWLLISPAMLVRYLQNTELRFYCPSNFFLNALMLLLYLNFVQFGKHLAHCLRKEFSFIKGNNELN